MRHELRLANRGELTSALDRLVSWLGEAGMNGEAALEWRLVAEEALTNIFKYAGLTSGDVVELELDVAPDAIRLVLREDGRPFDPRLQPAPDLERGAPERNEGGLGLVLLRALVDELRYERVGERNVLRLIRRR